MYTLKQTTLILLAAVLLSSCGRQKNETSSSENKSGINLTELTPADTNNAETGDWIIKQEMSDAEKLNPTVTNDATAQGIYIYIFESLLDID